jgi:UbiD family decarboxylase
VISRAPDSGHINVGTYRVQVHDEKTDGLWIIPGKHGNLIAQKYWSKGEDCPFLIACGVPSSMMLASAVGIPWGMGKYDFFGGLLGALIPIAKSEGTGLPMPAVVGEASTCFVSFTITSPSAPSRQGRNK